MTNRLIHMFGKKVGLRISGEKTKAMTVDHVTNHSGRTEHREGCQVPIFRKLYLSENGDVEVDVRARLDKVPAYSSVYGPSGSAVAYNNKKAVLPQGNRAMPQVFFSVEVRQQHSLQV